MKTAPTSHLCRFGSRLVSSARALLTVSTLAALAVSAHSYAQAPTFNTVIATPTGSAPWQPPRPAAIGDFNADGKLDALIVDGSSSVRFMRGNGAGSFARTDIGLPTITTSNVADLHPALTAYIPNPVDGYSAVKAADVNGDGRLDAICAMGAHINWGPYNFVTVLINTGNDANGTPQFTETHYFLPFTDVRSLTVGDLNGDGKPDCIVGGAYGQLQPYLNNGNGTFARGQATNLIPNVGGATGAGVIADVNGDGKADFVVVSNQAHATDIFLGNGDGTFQAPTVIVNDAIAVAVADVNKDGKPDLVEGFGDGSVSVFLNNGNGTFGSPTSFATAAGSGISGFFLSDVNGDGNLDVAASLYSAGKVAILLGNGAGALGAPTLFAGVPNAVDVTLADFTGDGKPDIAVVSANGYGGQNFDLLTNTTVFAPPPPSAVLFFTDSLAGPSSPNLGTIPAGKYGYTSSGLQRTQSDNNTDRPMVATRLSSYLSETNVTAEVTVKLANNDLLYFGLGQGDMDAGYSNEPSHAFYFRVHSGFGGTSAIHAAVRSSPTAYQAVNQIGTYSLGSTITLRIVRAGDNVTMSIVGGGSISYSLSAYNSGLGLTNSNTRVFFGNTTVGSVFSNLKIYQAVPDTTAPVITVPADIVREAIGASGNVVTFSATATDDVDGSVPVVASAASGSTFPLATTIVGLAAADKAGNTSSATFAVTVRDTTAPTLTVPPSQTLEATSASGAVATFAASATDAVTANPSLTYSAGSGSTFALGTTTVTVSAKDGANNIGTGSFSITVRDTTPPTIATRADVIAEATGATGANVSFALPAASDIAGGVTVTSSPASGSQFVLGSTLVTATAKDGANLTATSTFNVIVRDTTAPALTVPANLIVEATSAAGSTATFSASATDAVTASPTLTYGKASGSTFPIGVTTVSVSAKDAAGNTSTGSFTVTVRDTIAPALTASLVNVSKGGDDESTQKFMVVFSGTDAVGVKTLKATLNGVIVTNGQIVQLQTIKSGAQSVKREDDGRLQIKATSFLLTVVATDAAANTTTKTATAIFIKKGQDSDDKKDDDKKDDDKKDDEKGKDK